MMAVSPLHALAERLEARSGLGRPARDALAAIPCQVVQVPNHRPLSIAADFSRHVWLVVDGLLARCSETGGGERQVTDLYVRGDIAHLDGLAGSRRDLQYQSLAVSTLLALPLAELKQASREHPELDRALTREHLVQNATVAAWLVNVGRRKSLPRTAHLFCELAVRHGGPGGQPRLTFPFPARQNQIAEMLALTPVHVNRTLRALREERLVSFADRDACIHDWDRLVRLADFDPAYLN